MCGIAGLLAHPGGATLQAMDATRRMTDAMLARGPDAGGLWQDATLTLGHRRLAIIDLHERAGQPMHSADGRYTIVFNGEIYNHAALRSELVAHGETLRTRSDTEVLLVLFAREGERMLPRLRGMFAFAIWDAQAQSLFLARDPHGIKPLYYAHAAAGFLFASQVKALLASRLVHAADEPAALVSFLLWGSVAEPWTLHRGVLQLPAGHWLRVQPGSPPGAPMCWHDIATHWAAPGETLHAAALAARVRNALEDTAAAHLVSDVPACLFLSGGVDSGVLAALMARQHTHVTGITLAFTEFDRQPEDETAGAAAIAGRYGMEHVVRRVTREEFIADVPRLLAAMDQPSIDGVNTWFASRAAAERGYKVALTGVGGDELFCGYPSFARIARAHRYAATLRRVPFAGSVLRPAVAAHARWRGTPKHALLVDYMHSLGGLYYLMRGLFTPAELPALMDPHDIDAGLERLAGAPHGLCAGNARDAAASVAALETTHYLRNQLLRDADWASMAHSLELRTPFVDVPLSRALAPCTAGFMHGRGKLAQAASVSPALPEIVTSRRKTGFGLPMQAWSRDPALATLVQPPCKEAPPLPASLVDGRQHWSRRWALQVLQGMRACT